MARRALTTTTAAAALTTAAVLLLTACGGGDDTSPEDIKGAETGAKSPSASASAPEGGEGPDISVPKDLHLVFDFDKPSDAKHAAALTDAQNYIRALDHGIAEQDPNDPAYQFYSITGGQAAQYAKSQIEGWTKRGLTVTGTDKYYDEDVTTLNDGQGILVSFCRNQAKFFSKEIKTEKILYTKESLSSYQKFRLRMVRPSGSSKALKAWNIEVIGEAKECRR
ncbi:hypothetical protein ACSNOJ_01770 [Streptomyces sp. URMC 128]|uniref:hypothetical protein n=1 Tax=Streptomyces sp. URMC 128 TaxID=3423404 RepID=UPI003F1DB51F